MDKKKYQFITVLIILALLMFVYKQNQENFDMKKKISEQIQQNLIEVLVLVY